MSETQLRKVLKQADDLEKRLGRLVDKMKAPDARAAELSRLQSVVIEAAKEWRRVAHHLFTGKPEALIAAVDALIEFESQQMREGKF